MKFLVVFCAVVSVVLGRPGYLHTPLAYSVHSPVYTPAVYTAPVAISSQYKSQDNLGQYTYGYTSGLSSAVESRSLDGVTSGGYSYVDANGLVQNVQYTSDDVNGFRVAASNLPVAPAPEHVDTPKPVEDTPEVAEAKAAHLAAVEETKARDASLPAEDDSVEVGVVGVAPVVNHAVVNTVVPSTFSYATPASYYSYSSGPVAPAVGYGYSAVAPAYGYAGYAGYGYVPAVQAYGYAPVAYSRGHEANELPADDEAVAKAKADHAAAHVETKAKLAAAGAAIH